MLACLLPCVVALLALGCGADAGPALQAPREQDPKPVPVRAISDPNPESPRTAPSPETVREIPLESIYSTSGQKNLKKADSGFVHRPDGSKQYAESYGVLLANFLAEFRGGPSNVFLVRAKDIRQAIRGTFLAFIGSRSAEKPVGPEEDPPPPPSDIWMVAYLGTSGSHPLAWEVRAVEQKGARVRLSYAKGQPETNDLHRYFVWVPLGKQQTAIYTLEFFDVEKKQVTLMRRVTLTRPWWETGSTTPVDEVPNPRDFPPETTDSSTGEKAREVHLGSIYLTSDQNSLRHADSSFFDRPDGSKQYVESYGALLANFLSRFRSGPSNGFLVRGKDIRQAIRATFLSLDGVRAVDLSVGPEEDLPQPSELWMVAYLGTAGSDPLAWRVQSVERTGKRIRVAYVKQKPKSKDLYPYFVWVPLGELESGTYSLELFNLGENQAELLRRVTVGKD